MSRFDYYVIERLLAIFGLLIATIVTVIWVNLAARGFSEFFSDTEAMSLLLSYVIYEFPPSLYQSLPLAAFASSVFITCRLYSDRELFAIFSAGVSPTRMIRPFVAFGALMAAISALLVHEILPNSLSQAAAIKIRIQADISQYRIKPGTFLFPMNGVAIFVGDISETGEFHDVFIHDGQSQKNEITHFAETARLVESENDTLFEMITGKTLIWNPENNTTKIFGFDSVLLSLSELAQGASGAPQIGRYTTTLALWKQLQAVKTIDSSIAHGIKVEIHRRIAYSIATFLFSIIGVAAVFSAETYRIRQIVPVVFSTVVIVSLHLLREFFRDYSLTTQSSPYQLYVSVLLGFLIVLALMRSSHKPFRILSLQQRASL